MINAVLYKPRLKPEFPCIGRYSDPEMLVLFTSKNTGTVIYQGHSGHPIGTYKDYWFTYWEPYDGKLLLTNEEIMSIKVERNTDNAFSYPCLGIYPSKQIVLFSSKQKGTVLCTGITTTLPIGTWSDNWVPDWTPYIGTVTLTND